MPEGLLVIRPNIAMTPTVWGTRHAPVPTPRGGRWPAPEPSRPIGLLDSWWLVAAAALASTGLLGAALWIATHVNPDPALHTAGLFVHLAGLMLGFGGVLIADYLAALWLLGRSTLAEAMAGVSRMHVPIWLGLAALVASGIVLEPNLDSPLTQTKMVLTALLTVNGLQTTVLSRRLADHSAAPLPPRLLVWGATSGAISQVCWWGAMAIGFWNAQR
ncbi:hypothetical protein ACFVAV_27100 [Nocardia sp. NPDC057663]|uniref:hypothetical protein n=1 Tax=Nocardia sp. NPDC057663 TaxID=3346201 RepID=UPI00366AECEE